MQAKLTTSLIAATEWRMERWQLAFDSLVFVFSLMLLPDLQHRCNYLVENQSADGGKFGLCLPMERSQSASMWADHAITKQQSIVSKIYRIELEDIVALHSHCSF